MDDNKVRIAIFASGGGSNAEAIMEHFQGHPLGEVGLVCTNKAEAGVLQRAERYGVPRFIMSKETYSDSEALTGLMKSHRIDLVVLAGYLKLVPAGFTRAFHKRIVNIHPGILPQYGGKGMYGIHVHKAVLADKAPWSGITIHFVDDQYDHGPTIFQHAFPIDPNWSPQELATAVLKVEHAWYPQVVEGVCEELAKRKANRLNNR